MWQLEGSTHELTLILEEQCFVLTQVTCIDEMLAEMGESKGSDSEDEDDSDEDSSKREDGAVE